jgi:cellulose synthase/poly-beta-1,6-N-acetylglucosamine synthase-like glycosyltransferase
MVTLDADTVIAPNALQAFITDFQNNPNLVASGGVLQPVCRPNRFSRLFNFFFEFFQQFEYIFSFLSRGAWYKANALLLVSGAFAIYRTEVLKQVGGFDPDSMVEDYELNHRIYRYASEHDLDWTVGITGEAYGVTDAPNGFKAFLHQRKRWFGGFLQTQFAHLDMMANQKYGAVGRLMLPMKMFDAIQPFLGLSAFIILGILIAQADFTQPNPVLYAILLIILGKMTLDLVYHCWGMWLYHRWTGISLSRNNFPAILLATIFAPFTFQIVKLMGAALGWWVFLTNQKNWRAQREL